MGVTKHQEMGDKPRALLRRAGSAGDAGQPKGKLPNVSFECPENRKVRAGGYSE